MESAQGVCAGCLLEASGKEGNRCFKARMGRKALIFQNSLLFCMVEKYEMKKFWTPACDPGVVMSCIHKHGEVKDKLSKSCPNQHVIHCVSGSSLEPPLGLVKG